MKIRCAAARLLRFGKGETGHAGIALTHQQLADARTRALAGAGDGQDKQTA